MSAVAEHHPVGSFRLPHRMADIGYAIDAYLGELARRGRQPTTLTTYRRLLNDFAGLIPEKATDEINLADYERFLNRWVGKSPSTLASGVSLVKGFARFLFERGLSPVDVAYPLKRPTRQRPEDLDVVTVADTDAVKMIEACDDWQELLCVSTALYMGARRRALARARRADVDLVHGTMRFSEKGGKVVTKPLPNEYRALLVEAERDGLWKGPEDYLIPNRRPGAVRRVERSDKVIWQTVKLVAERAGVRAHVHSLRAAFAVQFLETHPGRVDALKELMGHARAETTYVYLRRRNRSAQMETVRDLSWGGGFVFESQPGEPPESPCKTAVEAHTGFEPVFAENALPEPIGRKLAALRARAVARKARA